MKLHFKVYRFDPQTDAGPTFKHYGVTAQPEERILDCLNRIRWEQDGTLSYRMSCGHGVCGSDAMRINGTCRLACQALVKDYQCPEVVLEPLPAFRVLKDLIVDIDPFLEGIRLIQPYLVTGAPPPAKERLQSPEERRKVDTVIRCILCGCCTASCPVKWVEDKYLGPAAMVWAYRYLFDSRDDHRAGRLEQLDAIDLAWGCVSHFECTRVCPKEIPVTKSINEVKREIEKARR